MKIHLELTYKALDNLMIAGLIDLLDTIDKQPNLTHPEDVKQYKKLRKAADTLLKYYGI